MVLTKDDNVKKENLTLPTPPVPRTIILYVGLSFNFFVAVFEWPFVDDVRCFRGICLCFFFLNETNLVFSTPKYMHKNPKEKERGTVNR